MALLRRHNGCDSVSNHQPRDCLFSSLLRRISKKTPKLRVSGLCEGNSPVTDKFPTQRASNAENLLPFHLDVHDICLECMIWNVTIVLPCFIITYNHNYRPGNDKCVLSGRTCNTGTIINHPAWCFIISIYILIPDCVAPDLITGCLWF